MDVPVALAEYAAGMLPGESAPKVAMALLEAGHDAPELCELATMNSPTWRDARELFERGIATAGYEIPPVARAHEIVLAATLARLATGAVRPRVGAGRIWSIWHELGAPFDLSVFIGLADEWDDHPDEREAIEAEIVAQASQLQSQYGARAG